MSKIEKTLTLRTASMITLISMILFFVNTFLAIIFYPGGTYRDPNTVGYHFFSNFFSDLGRTTNFNGNSQSLSFFLFNSSLIIIGLTIIPFFILLPSLFNKNRKMQTIIKLGCLFGMIAGLCYIGIGFTPWDLFYPQHMIFVKSAFFALFLSMLLCSLAMWTSSIFPIRYPIVLSLFSVVAASYVWLIFFGPGFNTPHGLMIQVAGQKIIVYLELCALSFFSFGAYNITSKKI